MKFVEVKTSQDFDNLRVLFKEYFSAQKDSLGCQDFEGELDSLEKLYNNDDTSFILVKDLDHRLVACGGIKKLDDDSCELKRVYVRPEYRGRGIARELTNIAINKAKKNNFAKIVLDTSHNLKSALNLYYSLGFEHIEPYYESPCHNPLYLALEL